jgi:hypothetical protein
VGWHLEVRSNFLAVELDHDTGAMTDEIIAGRLAGTKLDQLELSTLVSLLGEFDAESRDLLATYHRCRPACCPAGSRHHRCG